MSVSAKREIVIKDACILIDLIDLGLLSVFYQLDLLVITTPLVVAEITDPGQLAEVTVYINNGHLLIDNAADVLVLTTITAKHRGLSIADASVLEVANRKSACVLSSDGSLRNVSMKQGMIVRGMLWVLEELYMHRLIGLTVMLEKLDLYPKVNNRAPKKEIQLLRKKYTPEETSKIN